MTAHLVLLGFFQVSSEDTWWHLKQGELYVTTRSLPAQERLDALTHAATLMTGRIGENLGGWMRRAWRPSAL